MRVFMLAATLASLSAPLFSTAAWSQPDRAGDRSDRFAPGVTVRPSRMLAGPDASYPPVRSFGPGFRVDIYGCLNDRSWCDVGYGSDRGWMPGQDLASDYQGRRQAIDVLATALGIGVLTFNLGPYWDDHYRARPFYNDRYSWEQRYFDSYRPSWGPRPDRSYWGGRTATSYTLRRVWMRAGPDYDYPAIRRIGRGNRVHVYGCLMDWGWCDVTFRSDRGWVPAADLSADYRGRRRAFNSIAPYLGIAVLPFLFDNYWNDHYRGRPFYNQRDRWQRHYNDSYKPSWGPRPGAPGYREGDRTGEVERNRQALEQKQREEERARQAELDRQRDERNRLLLEQKQREEGKARQTELDRQRDERNRLLLEQKQREEGKARQTELDRQRDERNRLLLEQKKREEERTRKIELDRQRVDQNRQLLEQRRLETERTRKIEADRRQLELKQRDEERARQIQQTTQKAEQNRQQLQKQREERALQAEKNRLERERRKKEATQPKDKADTPDNGAVAPN